MMTGSGGGGNNKWTDEQEWERKKAHQRAMMARGQGPDPKGLGNGALGVANVGAFAQQQASQGAAAKPSYPTPADLPKYNSLAERQQGQRDAFANIQKPGFGMGYSVKPNAPQKPISDMRGQGVSAPNTNAATSSIDDIQPTYQESDNTAGILKGDGGGKRPGLSIDNNAAVAQPLAPQMGGGNSARGFGVMAAPRKAYGEDSRRAAIMMDIKPYEKMNGRLTLGQIALKDSIRKGDDEKYDNQRYGVQIGMAQELAKEGMQQAGANSRAQLTESGANSRANNQLGFDAEKFQQIAAIDKRKLDMQQSNDGVKNFLPKRLNSLYEKYDAAETPDEKSAIAAQIQSLNGGSKPQSPVVVSQTGESTDGMTTTKNPAMVYLPDTNEWVQTPARKMTEAEAIAGGNDPNKSDEEKQQLLIAGGYGSDE